MVKIKNKIFEYIPLFIPLVIFVLIWEWFVKGSSSRMFLFSSPSLVFEALIDGFKSGVLLIDISVTSIETISGFLIGNIFGSFFGLSLWFSRTIAKISRPYIVALGAVPIFSIAPMMIIWFGTGIFAKIIMAALSTVVVAIVQSYEGAKNVDKDQINLLKILGASKIKIFLNVIVPSSLIWVISSSKLNVGFALLGAFVGEFISSDSGLGYRILKAGGLYDIPLVLASIICIIGLSLILSWFLSIIEKKILIWKS